MSVRTFFVETREKIAPACHRHLVMSEPTAADAAPGSALKRVESGRVKRSYLISAAISLFAAVLFLVGLQIPDWFIGTTSTSTSAYGLDKQCINGLCTTMTYSDIILASCTISGSLFDRRMMAVRWTLYFAVAASLLPVPMYAAATFGKSHRVALPAFVIQLLALGCASVTIVLFAATYESWRFCGTTFCGYTRTVSGSTSTACYSTYGTGYVMVATGTCVQILGIVFAVAAMIVQRKRESTMALVLAARQSAQAPPSDFEAPPGFLYDPSCGLYYSDEMHLYLDPASCHYYDPSSGLWYDTDAELWYEIQEN